MTTIAITGAAGFIGFHTAKKFLRFENGICSACLEVEKKFRNNKNKNDQKLIQTLMGNDVALRKDFIVSNAINVQNLDI